MQRPLDDQQVPILAERTGANTFGAFDLAPLIIRDLNGRITYWSSGAEGLYGWPREEAVGRMAAELLATEFPIALTEIEAELARDGHWRGELRRRRRDGNMISVMSHWSSQRDSAGNPAAVIDVSHDFAHREDNDKARLWLDAITGASHSAVIRKTLDGTITDWSPGAERMFGYRADEIVGQSIRTLVSQDRLQEEMELLARIGRGETIDRYETKRRRKDGSEITVAVTVWPIRDRSGAIVAVSTIMHDLTAHKRREHVFEETRAELAHLSRLTELGQTVSALAHEVNQPLAAAGIYADTARRLMSMNEQARALETLEKLAQEVARATEIIRRLRNFVRKGERRYESENVAAVVEDASALALLGTQVQDIALALHCEPDMQPVAMDKVQIQQVLFNLMRNAIEAMAESPRRELVIAAVAESAELRVSVADRGRGLDPQVRVNLFKPFVTTKPDGMGIGLSICRSIVEAHGGRLWAEDNPGGGTIFQFTLPMRRGRATPSA